MSFVFLVLVKYPSIYQQGCGKVGCRSTPYHKRQTSQDGQTLPNIDNKTYKQKNPHLYWGKSPKLQTADEGKTHRQIKSSDSQCYRIRTQAVWGFNYTKGKMGNIRGTQLKVIMEEKSRDYQKKVKNKLGRKCIIINKRTDKSVYIFLYTIADVIYLRRSDFVFHQHHGEMMLSSSNQ